jgi:hypothetical protein
MHLFVIPVWGTPVLYASIALLAFWKGGWRERLLADLQLLLAAVEIAVCWAGACYPVQPCPVVIVDSLMLIACLICMVRAKRYWILCASSFGLLALVSDLMLFDRRVTLWASLSASIIWSYLLAASILWGVWTTARSAQGEDGH